MASTLFTGQYEHNLDDKGRLIIPSKFRASLGRHFYLLRSVNADCIWIMPEEGFDSMIGEVSQKIQKTDALGQKWLRKLMASVTPCEEEKQGRVLIPQKLRELAGIEDGRVTLIGAIDHIEVWSTSMWEEQEEQDFKTETKFVYEKYGF